MDALKLYECTILSQNMNGCREFLAYFDQKSSRTRPKRNEFYQLTIYPIEASTNFENTPEGLGRISNSFEGWVRGWQAMLQRHQSTLYNMLIQPYVLKLKHDCSILGEIAVYLRCVD